MWKSRRRKLPVIRLLYNISYYEINSEDYRINNDIICNNLHTLITSKQYCQKKSLVFIKRNESSIQQADDDVLVTGEYISNKESFLYPRLSQLHLAS